ncbi:MAG TPA: HAD family phosphatase [Thermodesulfobacteriota bacterium]|nr:HAD family phosphatase [Thermodesulfobacteriota bacterium]
MLKAVIFDFDGVIANTEPVHLRAFQRALAGEGVELTEEDYYANYLAYDDRTLFVRLYDDRGLEMESALLAALMERKSLNYDEMIEGNIELLPGAVDFIKSLGGKYRLAIGSGALEAEIMNVLDFAGIRDIFEVIVGADRIANCKPAPDVYLEALRCLNALPGEGGEIAPAECLVIEDSVSGIKAALAAGMKCLAVTNSYSEAELGEAHAVKPGLAGLDPGILGKLF